MLLYGMEEEANVLDNSHTRGNLHRTRNQRLPAGRVLIQTHPIEIARRARKPGGLFACQACRQGARRPASGSMSISRATALPPSPMPASSASKALSRSGGTRPYRSGRSPAQAAAFFEPEIEHFVMAITAAEAIVRLLAR